VDKLEQSDAVRSEEEAKATDKPLVFSKNPSSLSGVAGLWGFWFNSKLGALND